jgi:predicted RNA polymerase sigma factor
VVSCREAPAGSAHQVTGHDRRRRPAAGRVNADGRIVTLDRQDRRRWDTRRSPRACASSSRRWQCGRRNAAPAATRPRPSIAVLHEDAATAAETDRPQILAWYDHLVALTADPVRQDPAAVLARGRGRPRPRRLRRAARDPPATPRARPPAPVARRPRPPAPAQQRPPAATAYTQAARQATNVAERDHLVRQAPAHAPTEPWRNSRLTERPPPGERHASTHHT